jgi:predicted RNA-binding Zn-ribbon protein involved in translation (DUF1610 family)
MTWTYADVLYALCDGQAYESERDKIHFLITVRDWLNDRQAARELADTLQDYIEENAVDICPKCGEELAVKTWMEPRPYGSTVAYEEMSELYCPECGG